MEACGGRLQARYTFPSFGEEIDCVMLLALRSSDFDKDVSQQSM